MSLEIVMGLGFFATFIWAVLHEYRHYSESNEKEQVCCSEKKDSEIKQDIIVGGTNNETRID